MNRKPTLALIAGCLGPDRLAGSLRRRAQSTAERRVRRNQLQRADRRGHVHAGLRRVPHARCQGAEGAGVYPALAGNPKLSSGAYPVLRGHERHERHAAARRGAMTRPAGEVADVVNYVRTHFAVLLITRTAVKPADVGALPPELGLDHLNRLRHCERRQQTSNPQGGVMPLSELFRFARNDRMNVPAYSVQS